MMIMNKIMIKMKTNEIIANPLFFLIAGFETTSSTLSYCIYELSKNQNIQERLYEELCLKLNYIDESKYYYNLEIFGSCDQRNTSYISTSDLYNPYMWHRWL